MSNCSKIVFCDTSFVIRLLDKTSPLNKNAVGYFNYFLGGDCLLYLSTIAVAEFCVRGNIEDLPLKHILLSPFNAYHASQTGECAKLLYEARAKGVLNIDGRVIIQNDVKLLVQAECEKADCYLTSDANSRRMYDVLKENARLHFTFIDIHTSPANTFGILEF